MALDPAIIAAIVSGGAAITGSLGSAGFANAKNAKLQKRAFEYEQEMIRQQNEYNSPLSVLGRYKQAGLNPNLIYGDSGNAGMQTSHAQYKAPEYNLPDQGAMLGNVVNLAMQFALNKKELALKEQELQNKREEQFNMRSLRHGVDLDNAEKSVLLNYNPGIVLDVADKENILSSKALRNYDVGIQGKEIENAYARARTQLAQVNASERQKIIDTILPLQEKLMIAQLEGRNIENEIQGIERDLQKHLSELGGRTGVKIIIDLLRSIIK